VPQLCSCTSQPHFTEFTPGPQIQLFVRADVQGGNHAHINAIAVPPSAGARAKQVREVTHARRTVVPQSSEHTRHHAVAAARYLHQMSWSSLPTSRHATVEVLITCSGRCNDTCTAGIPAGCQGCRVHPDRAASRPRELGVQPGQPEGGGGQQRVLYGPPA
jgi:hypothetical protein